MFRLETYMRTQFLVGYRVILPRKIVRSLKRHFLRWKIFTFNKMYRSFSDIFSWNSVTNHATNSQTCANCCHIYIPYINKHAVGCFNDVLCWPQACYALIKWQIRYNLLTELLQTCICITSLAYLFWPRIQHGLAVCVVNYFSFFN